MSIQWHSFANAGGGEPPAYLPPEHADRWRRLRALKLLYTGQHAQFYLQEDRTSWKYPALRVHGRIIQPYVTYNLLGLMSVKTADLLFGGKAKIEATTTQQTDAIDLLARRSLLHPRLHAAAIQTSWAGGGFLEATRWKGQVYIEGLPPEEIYPIGRPGPDLQYSKYVRYATDSIPGPDGKPLKLMLVTTYSDGLISRSLSQLDEKGLVVAENLPLDRWPAFAVGAPEPEQRTGVRGSTITYLPNVVGDRLEVSDYENLDSLQDTVNAKFVQVAMILAKHAMPKLRAPAKAFDADGTFPADAEVVAVAEGDNPDTWGYITWDGQLAPALQDRAESVDALCVSGEMSPALLGIKRDAVPESARKLKLAGTNMLAKVARKALVFEPCIARAVEIASALEQASAMLVSYPIDPVGVTMRDGLPTDPGEIADEAATWKSAGLLSIEAGVAMRVEDPDAQAIEVKRIKDEAAASLPSSLMSEPTATDPFGGPATDAPSGAGV